MKRVRFESEPPSLGPSGQTVLPPRDGSGCSAPRGSVTADTSAPGADVPAAVHVFVSRHGPEMLRDYTKMSAVVRALTWRKQTGPRLVAQREQLGYGCSSSESSTALGLEVGKAVLDFHRQVFPASKGHEQQIWGAAYDLDTGA